MKAKIIGSITSSRQKKVGKLYKPTSQHQLKQSRKAPKMAQKRDNDYATEALKQRSSSVGKIYNSQYSRVSESKKQVQNTNRVYAHNLINYDEMESKLSSYLNCSIRTSGRQKYNYLCQNPRTFNNDLYNYDRRRLVDLPFNDTQKSLNDTQNLRTFSTQNHFHSPYQFPLKKETSLKNIVNQAPIKESFQKTVSIAYKDVKRGKENNNPLPEQQPKDKQNCVRKQGQSMLTINHKQHKDELESRLKKIIQNYEVKNKELSNQLKQLQVKPTGQKKNQKPQKLENKTKEVKQQPALQEEQSHAPELLNQVFNKLIQFNLKGICITSQCPQKQSLWRAIHSQIIFDEKLRIIKLFISDQNITKVIEFINASRFKKVQASSLKSNVQEYDPFLIQKLHQLFTTNQPNLNSRNSAKWIAETFIKCFEESERHWLKYLSQEKMECQIKALFFEKQITSLRKVEGLSRDLNLREFTRYLSTLFKANLRNRNVFIIFSKVKGLSYIGRFIELLEEKAGKGSDVKKPTIQK